MSALPEEFGRALLDAAKNDAAPVGAKGRAMAALSGSLGAGVAATPGVAKAAASFASWKWIALAGALATVGTGAEMARRHVAATQAPLHVATRTDETHAEEAPLTANEATEPRGTSMQHANIGTGGAGLEHRAVEPRADSTGKSCRDVQLPDGPPKVCSTRGKPVSVDFVNGCSSERVEVYWVDYNCKEVLYRPLAPGETLHQATFDTHPWRIREAGTHRLLKELIPTGTPLATDAGAADAAVTLPDLVVKDGSHADEGAPRACSVFGEKASLRFKNERGHDPIDVFWVDYDCHEQFKMRIEPGHDVSQKTFDAHPWRVRDSASGSLLVDFVPTRAEEGPSYVYVP